MEFRRRIVDRFFFIFIFFLPITSYLILPDIQGTTPALLLSLCTIFFIPLLYLFRDESLGFTTDFLKYFWILLLLTSIAQLALIFSNLVSFDYMNARLVDRQDRSTLILRSSLFTQSLYLTAAYACFLFFKHFYKRSWDRFLFIGVIFLGVYGIYEFVFYLIFNQSGDFISNRRFRGENDVGSLFQIFHVGSFSMQRLKSLTGEPSMYALTVLPFWIYAIHLKKTKTHLFLLLTLILSTAATAYIGIAIYVALRLIHRKLQDKTIWITAAILSGLVVIFWGPVGRVISSLIVSKLVSPNASNASAFDRFDSFQSSLELFGNLPAFSQLVGMGFGYIRSTDLFSTLLVNVGYIGLIIFTILFFLPVFHLKATSRNNTLKCIVIINYISMMTTVPEFSYLPTWLFLGMAYHQLTVEKDLNLRTQRKFLKIALLQK